jgi:hypothetical protein
VDLKELRDELQRLHDVAIAEVRGVRRWAWPGACTFDLQDMSERDCESIAEWIQRGDGVNPPPGYDLPTYLQQMKAFNHDRDKLAAKWRRAAIVQSVAHRTARIAAGAGRAALSALDAGQLEEASKVSRRAMELEASATGEAAYYWWPFAEAVAQYVEQVKGAKVCTAAKRQG